MRVSGVITLQPRIIYGGSSIVSVEYWVDKKLYQTDTTAPYVVDWNTATVKNGSHRITVRVTDSTGKKATHTVYVRVVN